MQKTGTITGIQPDGGYQSQNGYINTFQMKIQCDDGEFIGQIGSKSQIYPLAIGQPISVTVTNTEHGVRFKKFNPQYSAPGGTGSYPQSTGGQQPAPRDYDAENRGKVRTQFIKAAIIKGSLRCECYEHVLELTEFAMTGIIPQEQQQPPDDSIPF